MTNHPHRGRAHKARQRWQHATAAYSLLYRATEARTHTGASDLLMLAAERLRNAGDADLSEAVEEIADDWFPVETEMQPMLDRVAALVAQLERETLG